MEFSSYLPAKFVKFVFTNIHEQLNTLKIAYFLRKMQTSPVSNLGIHWMRTFQPITFISIRTSMEILKSALVYLKENIQPI